MIPYILPIIPYHRVYVEAFAGGAAIFFAKKPSPVEVLNDVNGNVSNFYEVMNSQFEGLNNMIEKTLHCEFTFNQCKAVYHNPEGHPKMERAHAFWVCCNLSFGGECAGSFQYVHNKSDNWSPPVKTRNKKLYFKSLSKRLEKTTIHNTDAVELILKRDHEDVFFYLDPPYVGARQGHYSGYVQKDFDQLLQALTGVKGKFLLSSYENESLERASKMQGWDQVKVPMRSEVQGGRKVEVLTWNYSLPKRELYYTPKLF